MQCGKCGAELPHGAVFCPMCGKKAAADPVKKSRGKARPNGTGSVYKRGKTWECAVVLGYVVDDVGKMTTKRTTKGGFKTKKEAMEYIPVLRTTPVKKVPTVLDLWCAFKSSKKFEKLSASRQEKYFIAWKKIEVLQFAKIDKLTTFDLQNAVDSAADTFYTARDIKNLLSKLYQIALPDEFVKANLASYIDLPELVEKEQQTFTVEEVQKLWTDYTAGNWWTGYILLMIYTGMMPGELLDARKEHIKWEEKQIAGAGKKTDIRRDTPLVIADFLLPVLEDICSHTEGDKLIKINKDNFYAEYYKTLQRAGCRRLTPYACRHTAATTLALEHIPPSVIQKIMRHGSFKTTQRYIHIDVDAMLEAVNQINGKTEKT